MLSGVRIQIVGTAVSLSNGIQQRISILRPFKLQCPRTMNRGNNTIITLVLTAQKMVVVSLSTPPVAGLGMTRDTFIACPKGR